jgi:hypothetical protein
MTIENDPLAWPMLDNQEYWALVEMGPKDLKVALQHDWCFSASGDISFRELRNSIRHHSKHSKHADGPITFSFDSEHRPRLVIIWFKPRDEVEKIVTAALKNEKRLRSEETFKGAVFHFIRIYGLQRAEELFKQSVIESVHDS